MVPGIQAAILAVAFGWQGDDDPIAMEWPDNHGKLVKEFVAYIGTGVSSLFRLES